MLAYLKKHIQSKQQKMFCLYIAFLFLLSLAVFIMPFGFKVEHKTMILTYLSGIIFWVGLIGTMIMAVYITNSRKQSKKFTKKFPNCKQLGLIHFFKNKPAFICDILLFISLIGFIITRICVGTSVVPFIFLSFFIFSFGMHCMLNGSNYIYINYKKTGVTEL